MMHKIKMNGISNFQAYRRQSQHDAFERERQTQDEMCGLMAPSPYHAKESSSHKISTPLIKKPQTGIKFYSCTTYQFSKPP